MSWNSGVCTYRGSLLMGLLLKAQDIRVGVGKSSEWPNELSPPSPGRGELDIDEPLAYFQPTVLSMAKTVDQSTWEALGNGQRGVAWVPDVGLSYLQLIADVDARTEWAHYLYCRLVINPAMGDPAAQIRELGMFANMQAQTGYESAAYLLPEQVVDPGDCIYRANGDHINMTSSVPTVALEFALDLR